MARESIKCGLRLSTMLLLCTVILSPLSCRRSNPQRSERPAGWVDLPTPNATINGTVLVRGWAADESGIDRVCVSVDQKQASCTENIAISRQDVAAALPNIPGADRSGWEMPLDVSRLAPGQHQLVVQATSKAGATRNIGSLDVTVNK